MIDIEPIAAAGLSGLLIALAWLWFWLREDSAHPEPRRMIALAFLAGMCTVPVVVPIEIYVQPLLPSLTLLGIAIPSIVLVFVAWSAIEEICKFIAASATVLWQREDDEPIDPVIYMVTVALGFAAVENTLFLLSPLSGGTLLSTIETGDLRFVGATLVHVLSSSIIGIALGVTFYRSRWAKALSVVLGVILAIILHSTFNFFIMNASPVQTIHVLLFVWLGIIVLLAVLEWVKRIRPRMLARNASR